MDTRARLFPLAMSLKDVLFTARSKSTHQTALPVHKWRAAEWKLAMATAFQDSDADSATRKLCAWVQNEAGDRFYAILDSFKTVEDAHLATVFEPDVLRCKAETSKAFDSVLVDLYPEAASTFAEHVDALAWKRLDDCIASALLDRLVRLKGAAAATAMQAACKIAEESPEFYANMINLLPWSFRCHHLLPDGRTMWEPGQTLHVHNVLWRRRKGRGWQLLVEWATPQYHASWEAASRVKDVALEEVAILPDGEAGLCCVACDHPHAQHPSRGTMVICSNCGRGWHLRCMPTPLASVPPGDWYCASCL